MLKIRLQRLGRKKRPIYRLVVAEHSAPIKGRYVESLGHYDPFLKQNNFTFDEEKIKSWIKKGAQPTDTVARLLKGLGIKGVDAFVVQMADRKKKNPTEAELAAEAAAQAPTPAPAEVKAEEAPAVEEVKEEVSQAPTEEEKVEEVPAEAATELPAEEEKPAEAA